LRRKCGKERGKRRRIKRRGEEEECSRANSAYDFKS